MNKMRKINIAIDGWSSCGKSTMARQLARLLNYVFIDSGAMYRAITLLFIRNQVDLADVRAVEQALQSINLQFQLNAESGNNEIWMNGENVEKEIRTMDVAQRVSDVAALKQVREFAVAQQQQIGQGKGVVMDGRDIGTMVFPDAELKIFMTASEDVRVSRRLKELQQKNQEITVDEVTANLRMRDHIDSTRDVSPLRRAEDAIILDNSNLSPDQQLGMALEWAKQRMAS